MAIDNGGPKTVVRPLDRFEPSAVANGRKSLSHSVLDLQSNTGMANLGYRTRLRAISAALPDAARVMWEWGMGSTPQM